MATPSEFPQQNRVFTAPATMTSDECGTLPAFSDGQQHISCWVLTEEEVAEVRATGRVWLAVAGQGQPPVWIAGQNPFGERAPPPQTTTETLPYVGVLDPLPPLRGMPAKPR